MDVVKNSADGALLAVRNSLCLLAGSETRSCHWGTVPCIEWSICLIKHIIEIYVTRTGTFWALGKPIPPLFIFCPEYVALDDNCYILLNNVKSCYML